MYYYAVYKGIKPGIYLNWKDCQSQINKYPGSIYKKFNNEEEAKYFIQHGKVLLEQHLEKKKNGKSLSTKSLKDNSLSTKSLKDNSLSTKSLKDNSLYIYTDGSCINNGKINAKGGIGIHFNNNQFNDISFKYEPQNIDDKPTNNKMELLAIYIAISLVESKINEFNEIIIFTDSKYSIDCLTKYISSWVKNNWKTKNNQTIANLNLIKNIYFLIQKHSPKIIFNHINSHTGKSDIHSLGNQKADDLAQKAAVS